MDGSSDPLLASRAERVFAALLASTPQPGPAELERIAREHPELERELEELVRQWGALRSAPRALVDALSRAGARAPGGAGAPGMVIGHFECVSLLGRGGMGEVWEAQDRTLNRRVALKLLPEGVLGDSSDVARFRREAEAAGRVQHPGVVGVYSSGESEGRLYIAQELVPGGRTLRTLLEEARATSDLPADWYGRIARLFLDLTDALAAAHESGTVHRDLKPQNLLLGPDGRPKVADFGLAKLAGGASLSVTGDFVGTWYYASPEQALGRSDVDARSDVFSLGATLYESLTLQKPFVGDQQQMIVQRIQDFDPPDPRTFRSKVPRDLALICGKALQKRPVDRYPSMRAFHEDLRRHLADEPILAREPTRAQRAVKWVRRHPTAAATIALSAGAFAVTVALLWRTEIARRDTVTARNAERDANRSLVVANRDLDAARAEALENARSATAQAREARAEADAREEVNLFLLDLFNSADPENSGDANPTARELVERSIRKLASEPVADPRIRARFLRTLAAVSVKLGEYGRAAELAGQSRELWVQIGDTQCAEALRSVMVQAGAELELGHYADAVARLAPLVELAQHDPAIRDEVGAEILGSMAMALMADGRLAEAEPLLLESAELSRTHDGERSLEYAAIQNNVAGLYLQAGRLDDAEHVLAANAERLADELARANPIALEAWNVLGLVQHERQRYAEAEATFQKVIDGLSRSLPPDHPGLITIRQNLARAQQAQGRFAEAEALFRELIEAQSAKLGRHNVATLNMLNNLALCLQDEQRFADAEVIQREVYESYVEQLGPDNPASLRAGNNLANTLYRVERYAEALKIQQDVVARTSADEPNLDGRRVQLSDIRAALGLPREGPPIENP